MRLLFHVSCDKLEVLGTAIYLVNSVFLDTDDTDVERIVCYLILQRFGILLFPKPFYIHSPIRNLFS